MGNKKFNLNLNEYRNAHYKVLSNAKRQMHQLVYSVLTHEQRKVRFDSTVEIAFTLYKEGKRKRDVSNVCSVVDKFVCDALVAIGILHDDDCEHLPFVRYEYGGIDRANPRVEIRIQNV